MTRRCKHEFWSKDDYPEDMICKKCEAIWTPKKYVDCSAIELMKLPKEVRFVVLTMQAEKFANEFLKDNPDFYSGSQGQ